MILVNRAYSEVTPESAEDGDISDSGMIAENAEYTFRELVAMLKDHPQASCHPARGDVFEWYSSGWHIDDYATGTEREETVHYSMSNPARNAKYWKLAAIAAGIAKQPAR